MIKYFLFFPVALFAFEAEMGLGLRMDELRWSVAGAPDGPNVLSELEWRDIYSIQLMGRAHVPLTQCLVVKFSGNYAEIIEGKNFDKDYDKKGREGLTDFTRADAGDGVLYDLSAAFGWRLADGLTLYSGYSVHRQALTMRDGERLFPLEEPIIGLDTHYHTLWQGPWVGIEIRSPRFRYSFDYHQVIYDGKGFWNLRNDFLGKFKHDAYGFGVTGECGIRLPLSRMAGIGLVVSGQYWRTHSGKGTTPTTDGMKIGKLNEVVWWSVAGSLTVDVCF